MIALAVIIAIGLVAVSAASVARAWVVTSARVRSEGQRQGATSGLFGTVFGLVRDGIEAAAQGSGDD